MANTLSSKKNVRVAERRTAINRSRKGRIKTFCRKVLEAIEKGDKETAKTDFVAFESEIMKGVTKGVYKKNTAARKLRRIAAQIREMK